MAISNLRARIPGTLSVAGVVASDGVILPIDSLAQTLAGYTADGPGTCTVVYLGTSYVQTYSYTGGNLTGISEWMAA